MHVLYAQTKKAFFQLRRDSLKGVKWCCSLLWELQKPKSRKKTHRALLQLQNPLQTKAIRPEQGFYTQCVTLSSAFACVCNRLRQASGRFWEYRYRGTNQPPQEGRQASKTPLAQRVDFLMQTPWHPSSLQQLSNRSVKVGIWKHLRLLELQRYLSSKGRSIAEGKRD